MKNAALETLFYPLEQDLIPAPNEDSVVGFLNAQTYHFVNQMRAAEIFCQQSFKPYVEKLQVQNYKISPDFKIETKRFDYILILLPAKALEAEFMIAQALKSLKNGGLILCAASNNAGGNRIKKWLKNFGVTQVSEHSKNKARVVWAIKNKTDNAAIQSAYQNGLLRENAVQHFTSQPGIYGWNKIDKGSEILTDYLPDTLKGTGADFGCGYGYLADALLKKNENISALHCIDADWRAVQACRINLEAASHNAQISFMWEDLTKPVAGLGNLDFIIMNPPFHEGKTTSSMIGKSFIETAHHSLRNGGSLYMVANAHLPYEEILRARFKTIKAPHEGQGFKVFIAQK